MTDEPLLDPAVQADPYPYYDQLRKQQPVLRMPGTGFYVLTRYEDLRAVLRDPGTFSNALDLEELSGEQARRLGALYQQRLTEKGCSPPPRACSPTRTPRSSTPTSRPKPSITSRTSSENAALNQKTT